MAQIVVVPKTKAQIDAYADQFKCCAADMAYSIANDISKGVEVCECKDSELMYLAYASQILADYYPVGSTYSIRFGMPRATFPFDANTGRITQLQTYLNGVPVLNILVNFLTTAEMIDWIIVNALPIGYTGTRDGNTMTVTAGLATANGVTLQIDYTDSLKLHSLLETFSNLISIVQTDDNVCISTNEAQQIIENGLGLCGCDCITNDDNI